MACSLARSLDLVGEPWTPLILRDIWLGRRRFDEIQADLEISRKVLLSEDTNPLERCGIIPKNRLSFPSSC